MIIMWLRLDDGDGDRAVEEEGSEEEEEREH